MGATILLFLIPLAAWILIAKVKFGHEFSWSEMGIQGAFTAFVITLLSLAGYHSQTSDVMLVNGVVIDTEAQRESCNQFWSDWPDGFCTNQQTRQVRDGETCSTDSKGNRTCTPRYKTQYRSIYPWEIRYFVSSDIPSGYEIRRVDAQGALVPPRFAEVEIGDPVTMEVPYTNYIKGAADTLFNQKLEDVPPIAYPGTYDYYKVRRVIYFGTPANSSMVEQWNEDLSVLNSEIRATRANVIINVVGESQNWAEGLAQAWDAHNINDVVVSIGVDQDRIQWVDVRSWSKNEMVDIVIRDEILSIGTIDPQRINAVIKDAITTNFEMQDMSAFEYLADDIDPPTWLYVIAGIILLIITPITSIYLSRNDIKDIKMPFNHHNRRRY
jgi:hypothetical protein